MPDYSKGKIYTLRCKYDTTLIYVGSTINPLYKRLGNHKTASRQEKRKSKVYTTVNNDWENWYIELYELYPCVNIEELTKREGEIIRLISTLNERVAGRSDKEYRLEKAEQIQKRKQEYRIKHADKMKGQRKEYRETNKEKLLEQKTEYAKNNSEKIKEYNKEYREKNIETIKEKDFNRQITCDKCGLVIKSHLKSHKSTNKCMNFTPQ